MVADPCAPPVGAAPATGASMVSHRAVLLILAIGALGALYAWQYVGIEHFLNSFGAFCM